MNSLRKILYNLKEEFVTGYEPVIGLDYVEIFKNPTEQEIREMVFEQSNKIRFIADKDKREVYIASGYKTYHEDMADELNIDYEIKFSGKGEFDGRKIKNLEMGNETFYAIGEELAEDIVKGDYDWMEDYNFKLSDYKEELKIRFSIE